MTIQANRERVWILEMNSSPLKVTKDEKTKKHKFRGTCAEFDGELNENNRLYDKRNYDEKVRALQEKISKRALCGELDHNEDFLVSMKNVSHIITEVKDMGKSYEIEIELIPGTTQGDNAIALAEAEVPLFISSRASGYIDKRGNVSLEKIYTYDLVSEPGFKNAELVPVNESLGQYKIKADGTPVSIKRFKNSEVRIYKFTDSEHKGNTQKPNSQINKQNTGDMAYATKAEILEVNKKLDALLKGGLRAINESLQTPNKLKFNGIPVEMLNKIPKMDDVLTVDSVDFKVKKVENVDESMDTSPNFKLRGTYAYTMNLEGTDGSNKVGYITKTGEFHIADEGVARMAVQESAGVDAKMKRVFEAIEAKVNELIDVTNTARLEQKMVAKYIDGIAKLLEVTVNDHDKMVKFVNLLADHADNSTLVLNKVIEQSDKFIGRVNLITESLEATQQHANLLGKHTDNVVKVMNKLIVHQDKSAVHMNLLHQHADQLTNVVNIHESKFEKGVRVVPKVTKPAAPTATAQKVNESAGAAKGKETILDTTKKILTKVKSNKTEESRAVLEAKFPFTKQFSQEELAVFSKLTDNQKTYVFGKVGANARKANVMEAIREAEKQSDQLAFLSLMPKEKKAEWSMLPTARKQSIISLFQSKNLRSKAAIENFWDNIDLKPSKTQGLVRRVDESVEQKQLQDSAMGYNAADMDAALGLL